MRQDLQAGLSFSLEYLCKRFQTAVLDIKMSFLPGGGGGGG